MVSVQFSISVELYNFMVFGAFCHAVHTSESVLVARLCSVYVTAIEAYWCTEASAALLPSLLSVGQMSLWVWANLCFNQLSCSFSNCIALG